MRPLARGPLSLLLVAAALAGSGAARAAEGPKFVPLFDGKTLAGWKLVGDAIYTADDGSILGQTGAGGHSFLITEKTYGDFILDLEVKAEKRGNSGIQFRSSLRPAKKGYFAKVGGRVFGYQCEIDSSPRAWSAGIYDEGRRGWLNDLKDNEPGRKAFQFNAWNRFRIQCIGDHIQTWINGVPCADLVDSMTLEGFFGLQVHGERKGQKNARIRWRNLRIADLGRRRWLPLWAGKSLDGWHKQGGGAWTIEDGVLVGRHAKAEPRHGHLISDKVYADFTVHLKYKPVQGNSGFYFRVDEVGGNVGVHGFQSEIDPQVNPGGLYETGGRGWVARPSPAFIKKHFKPGQWNEMWVSAHGGRIVTHINGHKAVELKNDKGRPKGHIAIQLHGGADVEVRFKDIQIMSEPGEASKGKL